ncbi:MAG: hypothetical protein AAF387_05050 [Pseudomonadota bacterium]
MSFAHGFGEQLDLEIPLWLWLGGAALTVLLSFAVVIDFLPKRMESRRVIEVEISSWWLFRFLLHPKILWILRLVVLTIIFLTVASGLFGNQDAQQNLAPTMVWITFWVGVTFAVVLFGNLWHLLNPFATLYLLIFGQRRAVVSDTVLIPAWPLLVLFVGFMFAEHLWSSADVPRSLALLIFLYSGLTIAAMHRFGAANWLREGEIFSVLFSVFSRFSPLKLTLATEGTAKAYLRPPAIALVEHETSSAGLTLFIVMALASVTFDGWIETTLWQEFLFNASLHFGIDKGLGVVGFLINSAALLLFPTFFVAVFWLACRATMSLSKGRITINAWQLMRRYATSLIPIAIAYHFAHYAILFLVDGQALFYLASDPFGWGWNLFGTANFEINKEIISTNAIWYFVVTLIVIGHMLSVYLSHVVTLSLTQQKSVAVRAGAPILFLMVFYTVLSLWVIAQPALAT